MTMIAERRDPSRDCAKVQEAIASYRINVRVRMRMMVVGLMLEADGLEQLMKPG